MDQFAQIKTMLSSFLGPRQEITKNSLLQLYLASEVEALEDRDFQKCRNEAVKLLSGIQSRKEERSPQSQLPQQQTPRSSSATSTFVPQTFQQQPAPTTAYFNTDPNEAIQPTISCLCHSRKKSAQDSQASLEIYSQ